MTLSHLIATGLNSHAAGLISREWGGDPPASAITGLPRRTFLAQVTLNGELTRPFRFWNESVEDAYPDAFQPDAVADSQPIIDKASGRTPSAETVAALDTLDERIKEYLEGKQGRTRRAAQDTDRPWAAPARRVRGADCAASPEECEERGQRHSTTLPPGSQPRVRDGES